MSIICRDWQLRDNYFLPQLLYYDIINESHNATITMRRNILLHLWTNARYEYDGNREMTIISTLPARIVKTFQSYSLAYIHIWPCKHGKSADIHVCMSMRCSSGSSENSRLAAFTWLGELARIISFVNPLSRLLETSFFRSSVPLARALEQTHTITWTHVYRMPQNRWMLF